MSAATGKCQRLVEQLLDTRSIAVRATVSSRLAGSASKLDIATVIPGVAPVPFRRLFVDSIIEIRVCEYATK